MAGYKNGTRLDQAFEDRMFDLVRAGVPYHRAAAFCGISATTADKWLRRGREAIALDEEDERVDRQERRFLRFARRMDEALGACQVRLVMKMQARAEDGDMGAIKYILSRRFREDWGDSVQIGGIPGQPVQLQPVDAGELLSAQDLESAVQILAANNVISLSAPDEPEEGTGTD